MQLDFLKQRYTQYRVEISTDGERERADITNGQSGDRIRVWYDSADREKYMFCYAYQHIHTDSEEVLLGYINDYMSGRKASIEFFAGDRRCFGGDIDALVLDHLTYEALCQCYPRFDLSEMNFKVRSWNRAYCFDGCFINDDDEGIHVVKKYC